MMYNLKFVTVPKSDMTRCFSLKFFNVNFKGNIKNIETSLDYNQAKTDQLIGDMLEKKMKKVIKDKLDNKFNDIIENLLE